MLHKAIQNRWCRLALAVAATLLYAIGVNWFIVPMGLYTGGLLGFCQVARTLIVEALGLSPNVDFSGILYLAANVPILLLAWQALGRGFLVRTAVCTVTSSLFLSLVPPPAAPLVEETLTNCVLGGILVGFSLGIVLTCGCSTGGLDILGLWLAKKGKGFSVGRFSLSFNALLYTLCAVLFGLRAAIYSIIYTVFCALFIDRGHQQNITEQVLIFTKDEDPELPRNIMARLGRGVTYWEGKGAYTGSNIKLMKCTGMREAWKMLNYARAEGMKVMVGCMTETSCAVTAAAQISPAVDFADLDGNLLIANDRFEGMTVVDGKITLPDRPGLGLKLL